MTIGTVRSEFLDAVPAEIQDLLHWYDAGRSQAPPTQQMIEVASHLLGAIREDGAFERSRELEPGNSDKNIGAFISEAFTYHQLGLYEDEVRCCEGAVLSDQPDRRLWLFYGVALDAAGGKEEEGLSIMDKEYTADLLIGKPLKLQHVFAGVQTAFPQRRETWRNRISESDSLIGNT